MQRAFQKPGKPPSSPSVDGCGRVWTGVDGSGTAPEPVGACVLPYVLYLCQDVVQKEFKTVRFLLSSSYFSSHLHLSLLQFQLAIK